MVKKTTPKKETPASEKEDLLSRNFVSRSVNAALTDTQDIRSRVVATLLSLAEHRKRIKATPSSGEPVTGREFVLALIELHKDGAIDLTSRNIDPEYFTMEGFQRAGQNQAREKQLRDAHRYHVKPAHHDSGIRELTPVYAPEPRSFGYKGRN